MNGLRSALLLLVAVTLAGCSGQRFAQLPEYEADVYPLTQSNAGVTVAIDEIRGAQRLERHFGADLTRGGVVPVNVVISNHSRQTVTVKPADILLYQAREVIDPLTPEAVVAAIRAEQQPQVRRSLEAAAFKSQAISPGETYRGVMFFAGPRKSESLLSRLGLYRESGPKLRVGLTGQSDGGRLLFGPFELAGPDVAVASSRSDWRKN